MWRTIQVGATKTELNLDSVAAGNRESETRATRLVTLFRPLVSQSPRTKTVTPKNKQWPTRRNQQPPPDERVIRTPASLLPGAIAVVLLYSHSYAMDNASSGAA
jgi:hypothetical protein